METFEKKLASSRDQNGFNRIRLAAAILVLVSHSFPITGSVEPLTRIGVDATLGFLSVAAFFVISGVLISNSFERSRLGRFVEKRVLRIMPALAVAVLVCVFVFGAAVTTAPNYFTHPDTWTYLLRAFFIPTNQSLPGVFADHPNTAINGSLWSLLYEVICYVGVAVALILPFRRTAIITAWIGSFLIARLISDESSGALFYLDSLAGLFRFFGAGMLLYLYRDRVPIRNDYAVVAASAVFASAFTPLLQEVCAIAGSYVVLVLAYNVRSLHSRSENDYSYGVYIYAFPVQQLVYEFTGGGWVDNILLALPITLSLSALSWHFVEQRALRLKLSKPRQLRERPSERP